MCHKANSSDLQDITFLEKQRAFLRNLDTKPPINVPEMRDDEEDNLDFEGMLTAKKGASCGPGGELREKQCVCEDGTEAVLTSIAEVADPKRKGANAKRKSARLAERNTMMEAESVKVVPLKVRCVSSSQRRSIVK